MRIGLDTTLINKPDGAGRYTKEMVKYLCSTFPEEQFYSFGPEPAIRLHHSNLIQVKYKDVRNAYDRMVYTVEMRRMLIKYKIDVFHNLTNYGIYRSPCPMVTSVLDLLTYKFPALRGSYFQGLLYKYYLPSLLRKAQHLIAISKNTRDDLRSCYGIGTGVSVVYLGYDTDRFFPASGNTQDGEILAKYGISPGYVLFVGYLIPKKNVETVIRALDLLRSRYGHHARLVIAGKHGSGAENIIGLIGELGLSDQVQAIGFVPDDELGAIYRNARVFVFPSIYEGFGLPVVEAMACGTPVVVSGSGSLPELVEHDDYMCPALDEGAWAIKLHELLTSDESHNTASRYALSRAGQFSWDKCVHETFEIYERVTRRRTAGRGERPGTSGA